MKRNLLLIGAVGALGLTIGLALLARRTDRVPRQVTRPTLESVLNVHGSPEEGLRVCGRTFRRVKGGPPYYLAVTNTCLVLFAHEPAPGKRVLVVCNTNDCTFRQIPLQDVVFGDQIGYREANKGQMGDTVESVSSNRLSLLHRGFRYVERSVLDLDTQSIRVLKVESEWNKLDLSGWTNQPHGPSAGQKP